MTDAQAHHLAHHDANTDAPIPAERFVVEALALLGEGVAAARIEAAARAIGRPEGALATLDAIGLGRFDAALHAELDAMAAAAGAKPHVHGPGCGHDHGHSHDHGHAHEHAHADGTHHAHAHSHEGEHGDGQAHDHAHDHADGHVHGPGCNHDHGEHTHGHGRATATVDVAAIVRARRSKPKPKSQRFPEPAVYVIEKMSHGFRRGGRDAGAGFYDYPAGGEPVLWSGLKVFERGAAEIDDDTVQARLRTALAAAG